MQTSNDAAAKAPRFEVLDRFVLESGDVAAFGRVCGQLRVGAILRHEDERGVARTVTIAGIDLKAPRQPGSENDSVEATLLLRAVVPFDVTPGITLYLET